MIATGDIYPCAEPRFQRYRPKPIACFRCNRPRTDICRAECSGLPKRFVVKVPTSLFGRDRPRNPCAKTVTHFLGGASLKGCVLAIQAEVIGIQRHTLQK